VAGRADWETRVTLKVPAAVAGTFQDTAEARRT